MKKYTRKSPKTNRRPPKEGDSGSLMRDMTMVVRAELDPRQSAAVIIGLLEEISERGGYPRRDVFLDFLNFTEAAMDGLPRHVLSMRMTGQLTEDPEPVKKFYEGMRERYPEAWILKNFCIAMGTLAFISTDIPQDVIGQVYTRWVEPDKKGLVPSFDEAVNKARKALGADVHKLVYDAMSVAAAKAAEGSPIARAVVQAGILGIRAAKNAADREWLDNFIQQNLLPAIMPYYEPVKIYDPQVGTGTQILAAATLFQEWMVYQGLVEFQGYDPDPACIKMTNLNLKIYGLNGAYLPANRALMAPLAEEGIVEMGLFKPIGALNPPQETETEDTAKPRQVRPITLLEPQKKETNP